VRAAIAAARNVVLLPDAPRHEDAPPASTLARRGSSAGELANPRNHAGDASGSEGIQYAA
jgi:hypothetical protein